MKMPVSPILAFAAFFISLTVFAQDKKSKVLDFEGDVIEGQKKAPELFLQLDVEKPDLSSVLYDRKSFNDYHASDRARRPLLSDPKAPK